MTQRGEEEGAVVAVDCVVYLQRQDFVERGVDGAPHARVSQGRRS